VPEPTDFPLPCAVHLGFAGSRRLFDPAPADPAEVRRLHAAVEAHLTKRLATLPADLGLGEHHFLVGVAQVAAGADTLFARACAARTALGVRCVLQRVFLPQHRRDFLDAHGSSGPDFTADERAEAEALLDAPHVIEERVVSAAATRGERFEDVNVEILRASDAVLCLLREGAAGKAGGTLQLLERATAAGLPVLAIRVGLRDGEPTFAEEWHNRGAAPPELPAEVRRVPVEVPADPPPALDAYLPPLNDLAGGLADGRQRLFKYAVAVILLTHVLATAAATYALGAHGGPIPSVLIVEFGLLLLGLSLHLKLLQSRPARAWAASRVTTELVRSVRGVGGFHAPLEFLYWLPLPVRFRPLLTTTDVLHLRATRPNRTAPWAAARDAYVARRLTDPPDGQIDFYERALARDERLLRLFWWLFVVCSVLAMTAALAKLGVLVAAPAWAGEHLPGLFGGLAVVLPVVAVGALSWTAALDLEGRVETFGETLRVVRRLLRELEQATSAGEFSRLVPEVETALLGETAGWFARRSNDEA